MTGGGGLLSTQPHLQRKRGRPRPLTVSRWVCPWRRQVSTPCGRDTIMWTTVPGFFAAVPVLSTGVPSAGIRRVTSSRAPCILLPCSPAGHRRGPRRAHGPPESSHFNLLALWSTGMKRKCLFWALDLSYGFCFQVWFFPCSVQ